MTDQPVPVIDAGRASGPELAAALERASCALLVNTGVPDALRGAMVEAARTFFHLPREQKARVEWPGTRPWTGWQPVREWGPEVSGFARPDLVERFEVQLPMPDGPVAAVDQDHWATTFALWPDHPADLRSRWTAFYAALAGLSSHLMGLLAAAYELPTDELAAWTDRQFSNLVANWYPPQPAPPPAGAVRQHAHTDIGGLTLLWADDQPGGLEVTFPGQRGWTPVTLPPDAFLVQAGDLLARWTNHRIRANVHRVVNPPPALAATTERISVVFFHHPDLSTEVRPAPSVRRPDQRADRAVHAGAHVIKRQLGGVGVTKTTTPE